MGVRRAVEPQANWSSAFSKNFPILVNTKRSFGVDTHRPAYLAQQVQQLVLWWVGWWVGLRDGLASRANARCLAEAVSAVATFSAPTCVPALRSWRSMRWSSPIHIQCGSLRQTVCRRRQRIQLDYTPVRKHRCGDTISHTMNQWRSCHSLNNINKSEI